MTGQKYLSRARGPKRHGLALAGAQTLAWLQHKANFVQVPKKFLATKLMFVHQEGMLSFIKAFFNGF